jgi:hypothetical protein
MRARRSFTGILALVAPLVACAASKPASTFDDFDSGPSDGGSSLVEESCALTTVVVGSFLILTSAQACRVASTLTAAPIGGFTELTASSECVALCGDGGADGLCAVSSEYAKDFAKANPVPDAATATCPDESDGGTIELTCYVTRTQQSEGPCVLGGP